MDSPSSSSSSTITTPTISPSVTPVIAFLDVDYSPSSSSSSTITTPTISPKVTPVIAFLDVDYSPSSSSSSTITTPTISPSVTPVIEFLDVDYSPSSSSSSSSTITTPTIPPSVTPVIAFLDVDSFECQIWQRDRPETRGMPCVVANSTGRILAASYEAKAFGISRVETPNLKAALKKCDHLVVFPKPDKWGKQDQSKLRKATAELIRNIQEFLKKFSTGDDIILEVSSSDEFYLNISAEVSRGMERKAEKIENYTGRRIPGFQIPPNVVWERRTETKIGPFFYRLPKKPNKNHLGMVKNVRMYSYKNEERLMFGALFLCRLCEYLEVETGLHMSGGVGKNKLLAKLGCGLNKPRKVTVFYEEACSRVSKLVDLSSIPGLGGATGEKLAKTFGISKMGDILRVPYENLEGAFGKEKATQFTSWALGQDVEPVEPKICNDQIRCNKPSGDIKTLISLKRMLKNLTCEVSILLGEEKAWYNRKGTQIKVEYKLESGQQNENQVFDIEQSSTANDFYQSVLRYFFSLPNFSRNSVHFTELSFVVKNFMPINASDKPSLCNHFEDMSVPKRLILLPAHPQPPTTLRVETEISDTAALPKFDFSVPGGFRITSTLQYSTENVHVPTLINESQLQCLVGYKLLRDFSPLLSTRRLIQDYNTYDELKHQFFSKWLRQHKPGNMDLNDVKFVTFHGRLLRALKTILNKTYGEWETYAMNIDNIIYLWDEKSSRTKSVFKAEGSYMGELFEQLVSGRSSKTPGAIDGLDKVFPVQKMKLGSHSLLILTNVDAQEEDGEFVQVQLQTDENCFKFKNPSFLLERNMKLWSQAVVSDSKKVVIGYKDGKNCITKVDTISVDELSLSVQNKDKCFVFLNRFLEWVNAHLPVPNDRLVKKFSWIPGQIKVTSSIIPQKEVEKLLLPRIYFPKE